MTSSKGVRTSRPKSSKGGKRGQSVSPRPSVDTFFRNGILSVRGYKFRHTTSWGDAVGAPHLLAEGVKIEGHNETHVIAKIGEGPGLEKEAFIIKQLAGTLDGATRVLRFVQVITIPPVDGDVKVVIYKHPGDNVLSHYMSISERKCFLLLGTEKDRERAFQEGSGLHRRDDDDSKLPTLPEITPEASTKEETEGRSIDLSSFLHFALQAVQCLEVLHATYGPHGDVRPSTFHWNASDDVVRFAHFGTRPVHLDSFGATATLVLQTQGLDSEQQERTKEVLSYLPPELAGGFLSGPTHLSDMYGLGATFWRLLTGRNLFFGPTVNSVLSSVASRDPPALHFIRPDVPIVLSRIVQKLLAKNPEDRYTSANGLKEDLLECNRHLGQGWESSEFGIELIKEFPLGRADHFSTFYLPNDLFGRESESKAVQRCIRDFVSRYSKRQRTFSSQASFASSDSFENTLSSAASTASTPSHAVSIMYPSAKRDLSDDTGMGMRMIVVRGSGGSGKSALVARECFREIPGFALAGQAKFEAGNPAPYSAILACLSLVFRQFLTRGSAEIFTFGDSLRERLGPQIDNLRLLYSAIPEIEQIVKMIWPDMLETSGACDVLGSVESSVRFQNLVCDLVSELGASRMVVFVLDDLHNADPSSLSMIEAFARGRVGVLVVATLRASHTVVLDRMSAALTNRLTLVTLKSLSSEAVSMLVCRTLHTDNAAAAPLVTALLHHSHSNPFAVRSLLLLLKSEGKLFFNFGTNSWTYNIAAVNDFLEARSKNSPQNVDGAFLVQHFRELPLDMQRVLAVAAAIGAFFEAKTISLFMEDLDPTDSSDELSDGSRAHKANKTKVWVSGLQSAIAEGMVVNRGRDLYAFAHDRYMEAALELAQTKSLMGGLVNISARLVDTLLDECEGDHPEDQDYYKISDQILRSLPVLCQRPHRDMYVRVVLSAGSHAYASGALESAFLYYDAAHQLGGDNIDSDALLRLSELMSWKGDLEKSEALLTRIMGNADMTLKISLMQIRARNMFRRQQLDAGQQLLFDGLKELGIILKPQYSDEEVQQGYEETRQRLVDFGLEQVKKLNPVTDAIDNLRNALLSEVFTFAYFQDQRQARMIAYEGINLTLRAGLSANNALTFISFASAAVSRGDYKLGITAGRLALDVSQRLSTAVDKGLPMSSLLRIFAGTVGCRSFLSNARFGNGRAQICPGRGELKFSGTGSPRSLIFQQGDALFAAFGFCHLMSNQFFTLHGTESAIRYADSIMEDLASWPQESEPVFFVIAIRMAIKAIAGHTWATKPDNVFDTDDWNHGAYVDKMLLVTQAEDSIMNWMQAFRAAALYNLGMHAACYDAGRFVIETAHHHPGHKHIQLAYFYSGLAACQLARVAPHDVQYVEFAQRSLLFLAPLLAVAEINIAQWYHLLAAEIASLKDDPAAIVTYDMAIAAGVKGQWPLETAWACYLTGSHFHRIGASMMGMGFHKRGLERFSAIGAIGVLSRLDDSSDHHLQSSQFDGPSSHVNVEVQTELMAELEGSFPVLSPTYRGSLPLITDSQPGSAEQSQLLKVVQHLPSKDLATLIYALQAITTDVNLSSSLERLSILMTGTTSSAEHACIVLRNEESSSDFRLWTIQRPGQPVELLSPTVPITEVESAREGIIATVIQHVLHSGKPLLLPRLAADPRFGSYAELNSVMSTLAVPIRSKGVTLGAMYLASSREAAFADGDLLVMDLLAMQAAVVIANGQLFASLRKSTQANLRALSEQRTALEAARKSQEEALHATRVKSIFLANMSHEMRTPFAAFYGVLGLLWDTELTAEQRELVSTARSSCELLLETISALLDFSKLEAHAVKLNLAPTSLADVLVDCQELLQTLASEKGLDLSYNVDPVVPIVLCDGPRLRQIFQNLIGNALKFTLKGSVDVTISVDEPSTPAPSAEHDICPTRIEVTDTGIGMSKADIGRLFRPFSQADSSTTRSFGGTGLGLSICRELVNLMGGKITVTSNVGAGSCFTCLIPLRVAPLIPPQLLQPIEELHELRRSVSLHRPYILVFSSSSSTRGLLRHVLGDLPVQFLTSLDEVKTRISPFGPDTTHVALDVVILDATHDDVENIDHIIQSNPAHKRVRLVHLSARSASGLQRPLAASLQLPLVVPSTRITRCLKPVRALVLLRLLLDLVANPTEIASSADRPGLMSSTSSTPRIAGSSGAAQSPGSFPQKITANFTDAQLEMFKSLHILIAEDNVVAQRLLVRQLQNLGFKVTASSNGIEAVERWQEHEAAYFRVAIFDHHMPLCDGLAAARKIRKLEKEREIKDPIPIVSLTADAQAQAMDDCLEAGMQRLFTKPLRQDDMLELIRTFILQAPNL